MGETFRIGETWNDVGRCTDVTLPRPILPGQVHFITRRCTQQQFLLRPSNQTNQNIRFSLAVAAERTGVIVNAVCFMSNHWHGVVTDPEARLPEFLECFHALVAKSQNVVLDRQENVWSSGKTSDVVLQSESDVLSKIAYVIANPTAAGLVHAPHLWPGVITQRFGERFDVAMPNAFFDPNGDLDDEASLEFKRPDIFRGLSDEALNQRLNEEVQLLVRRARSKFEQSGRSFLGRDAVLRQSPFATPKAPSERSSLSPRVAAKSKSVRVRALQALADFRYAYRAAWLRRRDGALNVIFPAGTYALRIYAGVVCALPP